jgi:multiple antibiotic resistance protein
VSALVSYVLVSFGSLFSIVDPFAAVPIFLALTGQMSRTDQVKTALRATLTCFGVLITFGIAGGFIFQFFGITLAAFKIAGGILLFGVGLEMMRAKRSDTRGTPEEALEAETRDEVGLIPLGLPLLSGPGAIATVMVLVGKARVPAERISLFVVIAAVSLVTFATLYSAAVLTRVLGKTGINVIGRVMGLILAAVAMQFVIDGVREAFPRVVFRGLDSEANLVLGTLVDEVDPRQGHVPAVEGRHGGGLQQLAEAGERVLGRLLGALDGRVSNVPAGAERRPDAEVPSRKAPIAAREHVETAERAIPGADVEKHGVRPRAVPPPDGDGCHEQGCRHGGVVVVLGVDVDLSDANGGGGGLGGLRFAGIGGFVRRPRRKAPSGEEDD